MQNTNSDFICVSELVSDIMPWELNILLNKVDYHQFINSPVTKLLPRFAPGRGIAFVHTFPKAAPNMGTPLPVCRVTGASSQLATGERSKKCGQYLKKSLILIKTEGIERNLR